MSGANSPAVFLVSLLTALLAGAAIPFQAGANATLGRALGHPFWATLVSLLVSLAAIVPLLWMLKVPLPVSVRGPGWMWMGGLLSVFYMTAALVLAPKLGAGGFIAAVVAGQVVAAMLVDQFGLAGFAVRTLTPARLAGAALIVAGMVVMQWSTAAQAQPARAGLQSGA